MRERDSIRNIKGVGQKAESLYAKLGIYTIGDLLTHYPRQYDVYKPVQPVSEAVDGNVIVLDVSLATKPKISYVRNLKIVSCTMRDSSGSIPVSCLICHIYSVLLKWERIIFCEEKLYQNGDV